MTDCGTLLADNLGLIKRVASRFAGQARMAGLDVEDLVGHACLMLVRHAHTYDPSKVPSYGAWAAVVVRRALARYCREEGLVRIPNSVPEDERRDKWREFKAARPDCMDALANARCQEPWDDAGDREECLAATVVAEQDGALRELVSEFDAQEKAREVTRSIRRFERLGGSFPEQERLCLLALAECGGDAASAAKRVGIQTTKLRNLAQRGRRILDGSQGSLF